MKASINPKLLIGGEAVYIEFVCIANKTDNLYIHTLGIAFA